MNKCLLCSFVFKKIVNIYTPVTWSPVVSSVLLCVKIYSSLIKFLVSSKAGLLDQYNRSILKYWSIRHFFKKATSL